jgi:methionine aminopeptidase
LITPETKRNLRNACELACPIQIGGTSKKAIFISVRDFAGHTTQQATHTGHQIKEMHAHQHAQFKEGPGIRYFTMVPDLAHAAKTFGNMAVAQEYEFITSHGPAWRAKPIRKDNRIR